MFDELYKKSMDDIKPDELLVQKTKNAMHKELKKKPKNFYKYATAAACLIITFSLFRVTFNSSNNLVNSEVSIGNIEGLNGGAPPNTFSPSDNSIKGQIDMSPSTNGLPSTGNFITAGESSSGNRVNGYFSVQSDQSISSSNDNIFVRIIKEIINWFKNLFN